VRRSSQKQLTTKMKRTLFAEWFLKTLQSFEIFDNRIQRKLINLEKAYQELLSLKASNIGN
jgi:hypothetical protein